VRKPTPQKLRRRYFNEKYPVVVLRFEDGHEIEVKKGEGKTFDVYAGETVKLVVVWDATAGDREVIAVLKAQQLEEGE
jgi:hypothetical protein